MPRRRNLSEKAPRKSRSSKLSREEIARRASKYASRYSDNDYELIAEALGVFPSKVKPHAEAFEGAARWYFLALRNPRRRSGMRPSDIQRRLLQISRAADRLLLHLGADLKSASDGPGCREIFSALMLAGEPASEDVVSRSMGAVARLIEIVASVRAVEEIRDRSRRAMDDVSDMSALTVPKGYRGDLALNAWTICLLDIHKRLKGVDVLVPLRYRTGSELYAFLEAAGRPLGIEQTRSNWRDRVKTIVRALNSATTAPK